MSFVELVKEPLARRLVDMGPNVIISVVDDESEGVVRLSLVVVVVVLKTLLLSLGAVVVGRGALVIGIALDDKLVVVVVVLVVGTVGLGVGL